MSSNNGNFPDTLVLPFTTLYRACSGNIADQIGQGNTFSVAFDMTQAPHAPGENGDVFLKTDPESNFQAEAMLQLSNEGLSGEIAFMSFDTVQATVFGQLETIKSLYLSGKPDGDAFTWTTAITIGDCTVSNVRLGESDTGEVQTQT